jgi:LuxR family maltose regulon positive regulatory protein
MVESKVVTPLLTTKLYIPHTRPGLVSRQRLVERLNAGMNCRLTLVSAPAGFGKTTLVSEWAVGCKRPVAWLSLDEGDNDLTGFLTYLVAALQTVAPRVGEGVLGILQSPQSQLPPIELMLATLLNELINISENLILVLDDYHAIESQSVKLALTFLIEHLPPQLHLVIATREDPPLPLARLRVRGQLTELRAVDLRFTPSEASNFLNEVMGLKLSAQDIAALETRTEGWIAGLQLAAISMQGHQDSAGFIKSFTGSHHFVLDYLVEEVLQRQSESVQNFLLRTSLLSRLCGPLCDAVLLDPTISGQETLEYLERANLFIVPLDNERRWYRYHHLFADLVRQRLGKPRELAELNRRASQWHEENGDLDAAFHYAITAGDFVRAAGLAELGYPSMDSTFQSAAWLGWVKKLPEDVICPRPVLNTQMGLAFTDAGEPQASESRLREAERYLNGSSDAMVVVDKALLKSLPAMIAMARASNAQVQGNLSATLKYAELALQHIPTVDLFRRAQATIMLKFTHWAEGDLEAARRAMGDWMDSMQKTGNFIFAVASAFAMADIMVEQGHLREAEKTYRQSLQLAAEHGKEAQQVTAHHYLGLAMLHHEIGEEATAAQHLLKARELGEQTTLVDWPYRWRVAQARLKQDEGDIDEALVLLDEARGVYVRNPIPDLRPIDSLKARAYLKQGRLAKTQDWVRERGLSADDEISYLREFEHLTLTRVLIAEYKLVKEVSSILKALNLLERLLNAA